MAPTAVATIDVGPDRTSPGPVRSALGYVRGAVSAGASSARALASRTGEIAGAGLYKGSYGLSYGTVFSAVFIKELLPFDNSLRRGFENGAEAAFDAVEARRPNPRSAEPVAPSKARPSRKAVA